MLDFRRYGDIPRFQLDRRPGRSRLKMTCPSCGRTKCFTPYIDVETGTIVGSQFGRCDHERTCGYHNPPKGKDVGERDVWTSGNKCLKEFKPPENPNMINYIPFGDFAKTVNPDNRNTLFKFLSYLWGEERVSDIFRRYYVGTMDLWSWSGCCIFWQIDKNFVCRTGKIMDFGIKRDESGEMIDVKRVKEKTGDNDEKPHVMFYHSLNGNDFLLRQCLFGEHLLSSYPDKTVNLVESEKTAIICSINRPDKLFVATGGLQNLRFDVVSVLRERKTIAFPDKGSAYDVWKEKVGNMMMDNIKVSDYLQDIEDVGDGDDIADLIIKNKVKEQWEKKTY